MQRWQQVVLLAGLLGLVAGVSAGALIDETLVFKRFEGGYWCALQHTERL